MHNPLHLAIGLPGSGRTRWFERTLPDLPRWSVGGEDRARLVIAAPQPVLDRLPFVTIDDQDGICALLTDVGPGSLRARLAGAPGSALGIDDLHLIDGSRAESIGRLVPAYLAAGVGVTATSRTRPPWPLARWFVDGRLRLVRADELALGVADLAAAVGVDPDAPPAWLAELRNRTAGWATTASAARQLLTEGSGAPSDPALDEVVDALADVLAGAVLADLDPAERDLLLVAAAVDGLDPALADQLLGPGGGARLTALARLRPALTALRPAQTVGPRRDGRPIFRPVPLLRRGLERRLDVDADRSVPDLVRAAAAWHRDAGHPLRAAELLVAHELWVDAARTLADASGRLVEDAAGERAWALFAAVPREVWEDDHTLALHAVLFSLDAGHPEEAALLLAGSPFSGHDVPDGVTAVADTLRALSVVFTTPAEQAIAAADRGRRALARIDPSYLPIVAGIRSAATYAQLAAIGVGCAEILLYRWDRAWERLAPIAEDDEVPFLVRLYAQGAAGWVAARRGEPRRATRFATAVSAAAARRSVPEHPALADAHLTRAEVAWWRGDDDGVRAAAADASDAARRHGSAVQLTSALTLLALGALRRGEPDHAASVLEDLPTVRRDAAGFRALATRARALARTGETRAARATLADLPVGVDTVLALAEVAPARAGEVVRWTPPPWPAPRLQAVLARSIVAERAGDASLPDLLTQAIAVAGPDGLVGPFPDLPATIGAALAARPEAGWLRDLGPATGGPDPIGARLTAREAEVLGALARPSSLSELAASLYLSVNTLKTHTRNIYRKLEVSSRDEAVDRARRLGLL